MDPMIIETKMSDGNTYVWVQVTPGLTERMKAYLAGRRVRHGAVKLTKQEWHDAPKMTEAWQKRKFVPREGDKEVWRSKDAVRRRGVMASKRLQREEVPADASPARPGEGQ